jgi:methyl-accepting chemotaxis protein
MSTLQQINASSQKLADIIGDITSAVSQQGQGVGEVSGSVTKLDQITQQNAALVDEGDAAAESLKEQAGGLASMVGSIRIQTA